MFRGVEKDTSLIQDGGEHAENSVSGRRDNPGASSGLEGSTGAAVARRFGEEPGLQIKEDLERLKGLLESAGQPGEPPMEDRLAGSVADDTVEEIDSATRP